MSNVIVAGANGFLGRGLVEAFLARGYSVTAMGHQFDEDFPAEVSTINVSGKSLDGLVDELGFKEYDCFYDLAWAGSSGPQRADYDVQLANVRTTCGYVELCALLSCSRFVYASSINETETYEYFEAGGAKPAGGYIYGAGKLAARIMAETVAYRSGVCFVPVLITNVYGAGERSPRLICASISKLLAGEHCSFTAGYQIYDFIYVTDAINSIVAAGEEGIPFTRYYLGSGEPKPLREFLIRMRDLVAPGAEIGLGDIPFEGAMVDYSAFDLKGLQRDTGYVNQVSFDEGILKTADWLKSSGGGSLTDSKRRLVAFRRDPGQRVAA